MAKYLALRETGIGGQDLRLLIVRNSKSGEDHAVLGARLDGHWLVLDNLRLTMVEDVQAKEYEPLLEIDDGGVRRLVPRDIVHTASPERPAASPTASDAGSAAP